jgi:pimeloyl-ACP methyl ester carboxylesterase
MLRFVSRLLLLLLTLAVLVLLVGPFLVDPTPAAGATNPRAVAPEESRFIEIPFDGTDGVELHYLERTGPGQAMGPVFVLLHGFTFNAFTWSRLLDALADHGRVLAYDQIPYGLSAKPLQGVWNGPNPYSKQSAREQLFAFLDRMGIERAVLVGNSSGGTLALEAALAAPDRIEGLILLAPWVHSKRPLLPDWLVDLPQMDRVTLLLARYLGGDSPLLDLSYADPTRIDDERRQLTGIHRRIANWDVAWAELLRRSLTDPVEVAAQLDRVTQPALVLSGALDGIVPVADTQATAEALPNATLVILPDCGHLAQEECPEAVAPAVSDWLKAVPPDR